MNCPLRRLTAGLLVLSIATTTQAEIIGHSSPADRERIAAYLDREDVGAELVRRGIAPEVAKARVAALTDAEMAALAGRIDQLPAGGDPVSLALGILFVLPIVVIAVVVKAIQLVGRGVQALNRAAAENPDLAAAKRPAATD